ncbi:MAG: hypothetical protein E5V40_21055, partial [Mesorhizobium sp.]
MMLTAIRPDRGPALAGCRFHVLMMFRNKVSGSSIEKSIDIVRVFVVRKSQLLECTMAKRLPPLNPLRAFEATARHASLTKAA